LEGDAKPNFAKRQMVIERGEIWWTDLPEPKGSMPGFRHPVLVIQANKFNRTQLETFVGVIITTNLRLAKMPGNVLLEPKQSGLPGGSVVNITQIVTANKTDLLEFVGTLSERKMEQIDAGLRLVFSL
jgi:mRNA interferase MazF